MRLDDPALVARDYATEDGLVARASVYETTLVFDDDDAVRGCIASSIAHKHLAARVPSFQGPLPTTRRNCVLVAHQEAA